MKNIIVTIFLAVFLFTAMGNTSVYGNVDTVTYEDDKKKGDKKKDPPGPVVIKDKKKDAPNDRENPKKGKKPDQ